MFDNWNNKRFYKSDGYKYLLESYSLYAIVGLQCYKNILLVFY